MDYGLSFTVTVAKPSAYSLDNPSRASGEVTVLGRHSGFGVTTLTDAMKVKRLLFVSNQTNKKRRVVPPVYACTAPIAEGNAIGPRRTADTGR